MNYKSPLCSCIVCHETKSSKGIFSHYNISHTETGKNKIIVARDAASSAMKKFGEERRNRNVEQYLQSPSRCRTCDHELHYDIKYHTFCSSSCAATYNNKIRENHSKQKQSFTLRNTLKNTYYPNSRIKFCKCAYCSKNYTWHKGCSKLYCSVDCSKLGKSNKQSEIAKARGFGGVRPSVRINYNGISLGSTYELKLAKSLDEFEILWIKPKKIKYIDPFGKSRTYEADFYLPEYNVYLDPKNDFLINNINPRLGFKDTEKIRLVSEQNNVRIIILNKTQLNWESVQILL